MHILTGYSAKMHMRISEQLLYRITIFLLLNLKINKRMYRLRNMFLSNLCALEVWKGGVADVPRPLSQHQECGV